MVARTDAMMNWELGLLVGGRIEGLRNSERGEDLIDCCRDEFVYIYMPLSLSSMFDLIED